MSGTSYLSGECMPKEVQARGVHIDIEARNLGLRYPIEVNVAGASAEPLRALLPRLTQRSKSAWRDKIAAWRTMWEKETRAMSGSARTIDGSRVDTFRMPTEISDSGGTLDCSSTTLVVVEVGAGGRRGRGDNYADVAPVAPLHDERRIRLRNRRNSSVVGPPPEQRA